MPAQCMAIQIKSKQNNFKFKIDIYTYKIDI